MKIPPKSLRWRLILLTSFALAALWLLLAPWLLLGLRAEFQKSLDDRLAASAAMVASLMQRQQLQASMSSEPVPPVAKPDFPGSLACRVSTLRGEVIALSQDAPTAALSTQTDGYSEQEVNGEIWRVYTLTEGELRISTAERLSTRHALMASVITAAVLPFALAFAGTIALLWFAMRRSFRPLVRLSRSVATRDLRDTQALQWSGEPAEVKPLVDEINRLLHRVREALSRERRFTANAAHELRTPLAGVHTQLQVAQLSEGENAEHALRQAQRGLDRLQATLQQLLLLARVDEDPALDDGEQACTDDISAAALTDVQRKAGEKQITIRYLDHCRKQAAAPAALLTAALRNLLENAIHHSPEHTTIELECTAQDHYCIWVVRDEGPGVAEHQLVEITQPFVHINGRGSGLGLSIVDAVARRFGGSLELRNRAHGGFEAELRIPAAAGLEPNANG